MIYLPLEHIEQRYTTHLDRDIRDYLERKGISYTYIEPKTPTKSQKIECGSFLDANATCYRQFYQMQRLIELLMSGEVAKDETLFVTDIWNFALMAVPYLNFFCGYKLKVRGLLHAGSFTDTDFVRQMERQYKGMEEALFDICDRIYLGSNFIKEDVLRKRFAPSDKFIVTGLPLDLKGLSKYKNDNKREPLIVFNGRNVDEKQPYLFELLKKRLPQYNYINTQEEGLSKEDYYKTMARAKVVVSFALQENFGYGIQEAVTLGCIPILPNRLAYVEQFDKMYLYDSFDECVRMVDDAMQGNLATPPAVVTDNEEIFDKWFENL